MSRNLIFPEVYFGQSLGKRIVDRLLVFFLLLVQIPLDVSFTYAGSFFLSPGLKAGKFLFISAGGTDKSILFSFQIQFHLSVAVWTPCIGKTGNRLPVSAGTVLAYQHFAVFPVYRQHTLSANRAFRVRKIIMTESSFSGLDLPDQLLGIVSDIFQKDVFL